MTLSAVTSETLVVSVDHGDIDNDVPSILDNGDIRSVKSGFRILRDLLGVGVQDVVPALDDGNFDFAFEQLRVLIVSVVRSRCKSCASSTLYSRI